MNARPDSEPGRTVEPRITITMPDTDASAFAASGPASTLASPIPAYRDLMARSPLAFALLNDEGDLVEVNRAFAELLDTTIARLRVMGLHQVTNPADHDLLDDVLGSMVDGPERAVSAYLRLVDYSGQSIQVVAHLSATDEAETTSILLAAVDLSGQNHRMSNLAYAATHDHLTGLFNRAGLLAQLHALLHEGRSASLALLDLDRLKPINDAYGHAMGDHLLRQIGNALHEMTSPDGVACRLAGDEFVVIADTTDEVELGLFLAAELGRLQVEVAPGVVITPTASIGTSSVRIGMTPSQVLAQADDSMYAEKRRRQEALSPTSQTQPT
jgi:diguanylate cyclase (GGDEF)-like protein/PAS domain S-box-containing protein